MESTDLPAIGSSDITQHHHSPSARTIAFLCFLGAVLLLPVQLVAQEEIDPKLQMPDVLVLISIGAATDRISFTYPKVVERSRAERHLHRLLAETGWIASNTTITDDRPAEVGEPSMTSVEFTTTRAVELDVGGLPLEPIIKAFKDLRTLEIVYVVSAPFDFRGLGNYENKHVRIHVRRGTNTYEYSVALKDPDFETLGLPLFRAEGIEERRDVHRAKSGSSISAVVLVAMLGLFTAALAYLITSRMVGSKPQKDN